MKKLILTILLCCSLVILTNGCKKEEDNYEHYNLLANEDTIYYNIATPEGWPQTYAIADITPKTYEGIKYGLFYQLSENDYILLEELEQVDNKSIKNMSYLYDNKLYIKKYYDLFEYTLNKEKIVSKKINFNYIEDLRINSLYEIKDDNVYISAGTYNDGENFFDYRNLKCSLKDLKCETYED